MSIVIPGNNQIINSNAIVGSTSGLILRTPTANSFDTFDTAANIITTYYGVNNTSYNGDSFNIRIYNNSNFVITLGSGSGITQSPATSDIILPQTVHNYIFTKTGVSLATVYLISSGTGSGNTGIEISNGNLLIGNSNDVGVGVSMSGDATIINTGVITLANTTVTPGSYTISNITVDSKGRLTTASSTTPQALTKTNDTNVTLTLGGTPATSLLQATSITAGWTGVLSGTRGGTGVNNNTRTITIGGNLITTDAISIGSTSSANQLLYTSSANNISGLTTTNSAVLVTTSAGVPTYTSAMTNGQIVVGVTGGIPVAVSMSGSATMTNSGVVTIQTNANLTGPITSIGNTTSVSSQTGTGTTFVMNSSPTLITPNIGASTGTSLTTSGSLRSNTSLVLEDPGVGTNTITIQSSVPTSSYTLTLPIDTGTTGQVLSTNGAGVLSWINGGSGSVTNVSGTSNRITSTGGSTPVIDIAATYVGQTSITTLGTIGTGTWNGGIISSQYGGTGVANTGKTITLGGNFVTSGSFPITLTSTASTNVTLPISGTLATTSQLPSPAALTITNDTNVTLTLGGTPGSALLQATSITSGWSGQLSLTRGGTNASLTASNGGILYSTASAMAVLPSTVTTGQIIRSGASSAPSWSTATYPATTTINRLLYSSALNTVTDLPTVNSSNLVTTSTGVPVWTSSMTNGQLIIGSTSSTPIPASLTAGTGMKIINGAGSITLNSLKYYDAIVSTSSATGDFTSISSAISAGAITIYVKQGIYPTTSNIVLPSNVSIVGESKENTILDFGNTAFGITTPSSTIITTGTVSITTNTTAVVGVGTTFTTLGTGAVVNTYIKLGDSFYSISIITNATNLILTEAYEGATLTTKSFQASVLLSGNISNIAIRNNITVPLITLTQTIGFTIENILLSQGSETGFDHLYINNSTNFLGKNIFSRSSNRDGIYINNTTNSVISSSVVKNSQRYGVHIDNSQSVNLVNINVSSCTLYGIHIASTTSVKFTTNITIDSCTSVYNIGTGINTEPETANISIFNCVSSNNTGIGIDFDGDYNSVIGCIISYNGGTGMFGGNDGIISNCIFDGNIGGGISMTGDTNNVISGCKIINTIGDGIIYNTGSDNNIIVGCQITNNSGAGINLNFAGDDNVFSCIFNNNVGGNVINTSSTTVLANQNIWKLGGNVLTDIGNPIAAQDAVSLNYLDNNNNSLYAYDSAGNQSFAVGTANARFLTFATVPINSGFTVTQITAPVGINNDYTYFTFPKIGVYEITYWVQANPTSGAARASCISGIQYSIGSPGTFTLIPGSQSACYLRSANLTWSGCGKTIFFNVTTTNTNIRILFYVDASTVTTTVQNYSSITIKFIRP